MITCIHLTGLKILFKFNKKKKISILIISTAQLSYYVMTSFYVDIYTVPLMQIWRHTKKVQIVSQYLWFILTQFHRYYNDNVCLCRDNRGPAWWMMGDGWNAVYHFECKTTVIPKWGQCILNQMRIYITCTVIIYRWLLCANHADIDQLILLDKH